MARVKRVLLVALGGGLGALARWGLTTVGPEMPWSTLTINLVGSFLIGLLWARVPDGPRWWLWGTGVLGGFTTFSALAAETVALDPSAAAGYLVATLTLGPLLAALGWRSGECR